MLMEYIVLCLELSMCSEIVNDDGADCCCFQLLNCVRLFCDPMDYSRQAPLMMVRTMVIMAVMVMMMVMLTMLMVTVMMTTMMTELFFGFFFSPQCAFPAHAPLTIPLWLRLASSLPRTLSARRAFHNLSQVCREHGIIAFPRVFKSSPCHVLSNSCSWSVSTSVSSTLLFLPSVDISNSAWDSDLEIAFP